MKSIRPRKLDLFIARQFGVLFVGALLICQFVLMMQFLWRYVDELIGKGLSLKVLAQFFWYMGLMLVPQALPLAILLSSLITFGNLGESSELTAIKAAGISLMRSFRSLVAICVIICGCSFVFQNYIGPEANLRLRQLLLSMRQKSPELDIPEGIFYDGIPRSNIYVARKDIKTGKLYGLTIYRMTGSYEDQAIILADSGLLQTTAEKKHLLMTLWNGEWFENMQSQELGNKASVPYRRETFYHKQILIDFDTDFSLTDEAKLAGDARNKGLPQLIHDIDSLEERQDSTGRALYEEMNMRFYQRQSPAFARRQTAAGTSPADKKAAPATEEDMPFDSIYARLSQTDKQAVITNSLNTVNNSKAELDFRAMIAQDYESAIRSHRIQEIAKFTIALQCLLFFFIGAPLGAIIRKGGLGLPVIISVLVFIIYYILDNSSTRMVKIGELNIWIGCLLSTVVLTPLAVYFTYKANHDSAVLNLDTYKDALNRLLMIRNHRHIAPKEVIIEDPDYTADSRQLENMNSHIAAYEQNNKLARLPNPIKVFFTYSKDNEIEEINTRMENVIDDLHNSVDKRILVMLNHYPIITVAAHKRPFERRWMNVATAVIIPLGVFFYVRIVVFRLRLHRDLRTIQRINDRMITRIAEVLG
ncbi:MAG: LptF/LptG family permease [Prevotella sp.]|nr:LptF/LptG family permease [Prevotella sp.]